MTIANDHAKRSDLALVLGTSMRVRPAADLPRFAKELVVVNLQRTPGAKDVAVFARTDVFLALLCQHLGVSTVMGEDVDAVVAGLRSVAEDTCVAGTDTPGTA